MVFFFYFNGGNHSADILNQGWRSAPHGGDGAGAAPGSPAQPVPAPPSPGACVGYFLDIK